MSGAPNCQSYWEQDDSRSWNKTHRQNILGIIRQLLKIKPFKSSYKNLQDKINSKLSSKI